MKTIIYLSILCFLIMSCAKHETINQFNPEAKKRIANCTSMEIPENYLEDTNYNGTVYIKQIYTTGWYDSVEYDVIIDIEYSENDKFIYIGINTSWVNTISLPVDFLGDEQYTEFAAQMNQSGAPDCDDFWNWFKVVIAGEERCMPCVGGYKTCYWHHWLFGDCCPQPPVPCD